jgi:hypothetical protein
MTKGVVSLEFATEVAVMVRIKLVVTLSGA